MGKYDALKSHLSQMTDDEWPAKFSEIEAILGFALPRSAYAYPAWWSNDPTGHSHSRAWLAAGWKTSDVDLNHQQLRFMKVGEEAVARVQGAPAPSRPLHGALKGVIQMVAGTDLTKPTGGAVE